MLESKITPRGLGVEIESVVGYLGMGDSNAIQQSLADLFRANGLTAIARGYSHNEVTTDLCVETDSSLSFTDCPYRGVKIANLEVKTRILNGVEDFRNVVPKAIELMGWIGCRVNASTGGHIHVSVPEITNDPRVIRSLYNLIHKYQYVLFGFCPKSRLTSRYCQPLPTSPGRLSGCRTIRCFKGALADLDRFKVVNFLHIFEEVPRLEFRLFASTLNPTKALNHARLVCGLVDHAVRRSVQAVGEPLPNNRRSLESLLVSCGFKVNSGIYSTVSDEMRDTGRWLLRRWFDLNGKIALKPKADSGAESD